jgi:hypothetical protein
MLYQVHIFCLLGLILRGKMLPEGANPSLVNIWHFFFEIQNFEKTLFSALP